MGSAINFFSCKPQSRHLLIHHCIFLTPSPSWTFISLLEVGISLLLSLIFYRLPFIFSLKRVKCIEFCNENALLSQQSIHKVPYRISGIFRVGLIFAEFADSVKSPKIDTAKNKPYYTSSLRVLEIVKIDLSENLTHLLSGIFAKISWPEKFPIYGVSSFKPS